MSLTAFRQDDRATRDGRGSENWRMGFHLMAPVGRMGRPRLAYQDVGGLYHVFFDYEPGWPRSSAGKGWGHYTSPNLVHWRFAGMATLDDIPERAREHKADLSVIRAAGPLDHGFGFCDPVACVDREGRTLLWGLLPEPETRCATPLRGRRWSGALTVPRQVCADSDGAIIQWPAAEIDELRTYPLAIDPHAGCLVGMHRADILLEGITGDAFTVQLDHDLRLAWRDGRLSLRFAEPAPPGAYEGAAGCDAARVSSLRLLIDDSAVEAYCDDGRQVLSTRWFPTSESMIVYLDVSCARARAWCMADGMDGTYPAWGPRR